MGALEVPTYRLFFDGDKPEVLKLAKRHGDVDWGGSAKDADTLNAFRRLLGKMSAEKRILLVSMAQNIAKRKEPVRKQKALGRNRGRN